MANNKEKDLFEEEEEEYEDIYVPSESVTAAKDYLKQVKNTGYDKKWADRLDSLVEMYVNREDFNYSPEDDLIWQQAKSAALRDGKRAMEDTVARAASLSGGYANSYAATAGAQVYENAVAAVAASADDYYAKAYERYLDEEKRLLDKLSIIEKMDDAEYSRYMDMIDSAMDDYEDEYNRDYTAWRDSISDRRYADETAYKREQDSLDRQYKTLRDSISDSRYADETAYKREQDSLDRQYKTWRDSISDARYADETAYEREQDSLDRQYKTWRDSVSDEQNNAATALSYAKLAEDARQFDTKQDYDKLKKEYDAYVKQTEKEKSDAIKAEKEREELEEEIANIKISPKYKKYMEMLKLTSNKEHGLRELYVSGKLGNGDAAMMYLTLLCGEFGLSVNKILE
ncbi:MAG: hypothetical protein IJO81_03105 [Clostridia bacterium]|nr:hypothetical protein [Clostridia bacterium]